MLYGHSAGAQFASHYCVIHPERVRAAVLSACGGYAFPNASVRWPQGMGPWRTTFRWDGSRVAQSIDVRPDPAAWARAAALPIMVVAGSQDAEPLKPRPGHAGNTRVEYALQWVEDMNRFAGSWRKEGKVGLTIVDGVGHDSAKLNPTAQKFLAGVLRAESREVEAAQAPASPEPVQTARAVDVTAEAIRCIPSDAFGNPKSLHSAHRE